MIQPILPLFLVGTLGASYSLGTIATLTGIITLPASLVAGIFWDRLVAGINRNQLFLN